MTKQQALDTAAQALRPAFEQVREQLKEQGWTLIATFDAKPTEKPAAPVKFGVTRPLAPAEKPKSKK